MLSACCPVGICDFVGRERSEARCGLHLVNYPSQTTYIYGCGMSALSTQAYYNHKCTLYTLIYTCTDIYVGLQPYTYSCTHAYTHTYVYTLHTYRNSYIYTSIYMCVGRGGALVESKPFDWRVVVGSNPALSAT